MNRARRLRVFIVDDEAPARARLRNLLDDISARLPNEFVGEAEHGAQALAELSARQGTSRADVVLVDIRMPVMDGIEFAAHLQRLAHAPAIVFTTAYDQYAVHAFDLNAVDYLLKPVRAERLLAALEKARARGPLDPASLRELQAGARSHLSCSERGRILLVPVTDILFLKAEQKYVTARTEAREYLLEESLNTLEQEFPDRFLRVHRNCLVARNAVAGFERASGLDGEAHWEVLLRGAAERLPVSRRQWPIVKSELAEKQ
ncbi:MAG: response regulator transcription factor [Rhodocyclaceae bacterium]|nr:response regulator transcription factor [Rhodocyclaceae bacterium]MBX3667611.1 response regulator transcription factor [Rhodocyclaceae bacterium]